MITAKDVNKDIALLELKMKNDSITNADVVKAITLLAKIAIGIRANQVSIMKATNVELRKPKVSSKDENVNDVKKEEK